MKEISRSKVHYSVVLTPEAIQMYSNDETIKLMLMSDNYLNCVSVEPNGYFVDLVVEYMVEASPIFDSPKRKHRVELSIPAHFVSYIVSVHPNKNLGFLDSQSGENKDDAKNR
jgi:isocitrate dehydrogenase kinase/phosphatase